MIDETATGSGSGPNIGDASLIVTAANAVLGDMSNRGIIATAVSANSRTRERYVRVPGGVRLLIIDSRSLTRDCLVAAISHADGIASIQAVADVAVAVAKICDDAAPDAILINFSADPLSDDRLASFLGPLRLVAPNSGLLLLSASIDRADALAALRQGVTGLLDSNAPFELVIQAICLVASGLMIYPAFNFGPELMAKVREVDLASEFKFTERQRQVLEQLQQGRTNGMIAEKLSVSERTVKAHVKAIMRRLGATNRTQIVALMSRTSMLPNRSGIGASAPS